MVLKTTPYHLLPKWDSLEPQGFTTLEASPVYTSPDGVVLVVGSLVCTLDP